jgi:hypothetical protein
MKQKTQTQQRWKEAILAQRTSGLNIKGFCEQRKLSRPSFFLWRKELGLKVESPGLNTSKGFVQIKPPAPLKIAPPVELRAIIETPNGYRVHAGIISTDGLKDVLETLRAL